MVSASIILDADIISHSLRLICIFYDYSNHHNLKWNENNASEPKYAKILKSSSKLKKIKFKFYHHLYNK